MIENVIEHEMKTKVFIDMVYILADSISKLYYN